MKKLALIILTAFVCLCLAGCADDTVTPNELTEPITPSEMIEHPVVMPTEPETPSKTEDNVIMLPEADENTKYITIEFPEDFPEEPYVEPNLVSPEEFEWGECLPFVKIEPVGYSASQGVVSYAIYSENTKNTDDARNLYSKLNSKYLIENSITKTDSLVNNPEVYNFLSQSRIIEVSPDLSIVKRLYFLEKGEITKNTYYGDVQWDSIYETLINGTVTDSIYTKNAIFNYYYPFLPLYSYRYVSMPDQHMELIYSNYAYKIYSGNDKSYVYSALDNRLVYVIDTKGSGGVRQITYMLDDYILFNTSKKGSKEFEGCAYLYDIKNETWTYLEKYTEYPVVSPDGKYLAYTTWHYYDAEVSEEDSKYSQKRGVYIKNLEDNTTVYFENEYQGVCVRGWIENNALKNAINS